MSMKERLRKASKYCESNSGYSVVPMRGEKKPLLVLNSTGYVRTAQLSN
ncbi:MAG: hypothetical protein ACI4NN_02260 [Pyramidobacter sp.]|jgi:hypothetical protein